MKKNFNTLEVGRRYENRAGQVVKIVKNDGHQTFPFIGDDGQSYTPEGKFDAWVIGEDDLIKLLPEQPTNRLAELEAKREELDREIKQLKSSVQTLYCEAFLDNAGDAIVLDISRTKIERALKIEQGGEDGKHPTITTFDLPFRKVNGKWEAAFEIVLK